MVRTFGQPVPLDDLQNSTLSSNSSANSSAKPPLDPQANQTILLPSTHPGRYGRGGYVDALRTENSDIRTRIHKVLLYLAKDRGSVVPTDLENWQSDPKNSPTDVDNIAGQWSRVK